MKSFFFFSLIAIGASLNILHAAEEARLLRFPAIHEDQIVFTYAGDLYTVDAEGGMARQLTSHPGYEMFARFSPDGSRIAFTGQYDGNTEVFVIPSTGGIPRRLTHTATLARDDIGDRMGPNNIVMDWTPDGRYITYRSRWKESNDFMGQLYRVPAEGGMSEQLPLPHGGFHSWSPDGQKIAYNRIFREFRTWKYYRGGMADEVWIYDFNEERISRITDNPAQDIIPMWAGEEVFFLSDRDRIMNLFVVDLNSRQTSKVTDFEEFDIKFPSLGKDFIVFENGGFIYKLDIRSRSYEKITVRIANDNAHSRTELIRVGKEVRTADLAPNGERVVFGAHGEVFTLPAGEGITRNLTMSPDAHDQNVAWSPDGKYIAFFSDRSGEMELYMQAQDGASGAIQLTSGSTTYYFNLAWSPDGKKILFNDRDLNLKYVDIDSREFTTVKTSRTQELNDFAWSPDSRWIAYAENDVNTFSVVYLYELASGQTRPVTENWYESSGPEFSPDGKYLYFVSRRDFDPTYSQTEWNHAYDNMARVYLVTLSADTPSPFAPENDEVEPEEASAGDNGGNAKGKGGKQQAAKGEPAVDVDPDGISDRIVVLPVDAGNYGSLQALEGKVYYNYLKTGAGPVTAKVFDLDSRKEAELGSGLFIALSPTGKKMLVARGDSYQVIDPPSGKVSIDEPIDLSGMQIMTDYRKEWKQIYDESWRQMRDFFYVENMHGVDWEKMHEKYEVLIPHVNHRHDLTYVIGELIGELNVGHAYVNSPDDLEGPDRIQTGHLGAKLSKHSSGFFRIDEILEGANWDPSLRSPLTVAGLNIKEGSFILEINGQSTTELEDIYAGLLNTAGSTVQLTVNAEPSMEGARKVLVEPVANEQQLYYFNWVQENIRKVREATDGQVGYLHIPDMGTGGLNEFARYFYPQLVGKKGLIIDDRGNGGGNVSPMIIERLRRQLAVTSKMRGIDILRTVPRQMMLGPKVLLINFASASDGDLFPYQFKTLDMGTVIGTRTWGGVVGIRGTLPFVDGGSLMRPEFGHISATESKWVIEGYGVEPDIVVDNHPGREYEGIDEQLNKAIEVILEQIEEEYVPLPPIPPDPDKSGR